MRLPSTALRRRCVARLWLSCRSSAVAVRCRVNSRPRSNFSDNGYRYTTTTFMTPDEARPPRTPPVVRVVRVVSVEVVLRWGPMNERIVTEASVVTTTAANGENSYSNVHFEIVNSR